MIPSSNLFEVKMDDFLADVTGHLKKIYEKFELGDFGRIEARVEKFLDENPCPEHNSNEPAPETIRLVDRYASGIMKELGYNR
jgi:hypothetical protein